MDNNLYNLPFSITKIKSYNIPKIKAKSIICNKDPPLLKEELTLKRIANTMRYLNDNLVSMIDNNLFIDSYFLLSGKKLTKSKAIALKEEYYKHLHLCEIERLFYILQVVNRIIYFQKIEFAILLINYFFYRDYGIQIVLYPALFSCIKEMFRSSENLMMCLLRLKSELNQEKRSITQNITLDDLKRYFNDNQNQILCRFPINRLYIFGSFAEGSNHIQSDLDILVIWNKETNFTQDDLQRKELAKYLSQHLNIDVDVLSFHFAIETMDVMSINKIISIY